MDRIHSRVSDPRDSGSSRYSVRCKGFIYNEFWETKVDSDDSSDSDLRDSGLIRFGVIQAIQMFEVVLTWRT